jgi:hypothetical protein
VNTHPFLVHFCAFLIKSPRENKINFLYSKRWDKTHVEKKMGVEQNLKAERVVDIKNQLKGGVLRS